MPPDLEPASALSEHIASVIARECRQAESDDAAWAVCAKRLRDHDARVAASVREPLERRIAKLKTRLVVRGKRIASLETQLDELRRRLHEQADVIAERDRRIGELANEKLVQATRIVQLEQALRSIVDARQEDGKRIASLEAQLASAPRWIPVEERLPDVDTWVLFAATPILGGPPSCVCLGRREKWSDGRVRWLDIESDGSGDRLEWFDGCVSHWMPQPELPPPAARKEPHAR